MFRNKEVKLYFGFIAVLMVVVVLVCTNTNPYLGIFIFVVCLLAGIATWLFQRWRYHKIAKLTDEIDRVLSGNFSCCVEENQEGELSVLRSKIHQVTIMLSEQAQLLKKDKLFLADSLSDISHQLKTPLTSMLMMTDLLEEDSLLPEKRKEFLGHIRSQLERIQWLVSSLLKLSRLDADAVVFHKVPVTPKQLVEKALNPLRIPAELKNLQIVCYNLETFSFQADLLWTAEALVNVLKNCIEHTPKGGTLRITAEDNPIYTGITIHDTGSGISSSDLPHIFERFYKGENASPESVGIGLAMAKKIIEKQSGEITVKSEPGKGSCFSLRFYRMVA